MLAVLPASLFLLLVARAPLVSSIHDHQAVIPDEYLINIDVDFLRFHERAQGYHVAPAYTVLKAAPYFMERARGILDIEPRVIDVIDCLKTAVVHVRLPGIPASQLSMLERIAGITRVVPNTITYIDEEETTTASPQASTPFSKCQSDDEYLCEAQQTNKTTGLWGLTRIASENKYVDYAKENFPYDKAAGVGVDVYVIDSGINIRHPEFEGRALYGFSAFDNHEDERGHGTHVAGTIGSKKHGVAKKAHLIAVKVLGKKSLLISSKTVRGMCWAANDYKGKLTKGVVNLSVGKLRLDPEYDIGVKAMRDVGLVAVTSAGNDYTDACRAVPSKYDELITVAAEKPDRTLKSSSNYGPCVDISAPGERVLSTSYDLDQYEVTKSGTSMASPHVAGAVAVYLSKHEAQPHPDEVERWLKKVAKPHIKLGSNKPNTTNLRLYLPCPTVVEEHKPVQERFMPDQSWLNHLDDSDSGTAERAPWMDWSREQQPGVPVGRVVGGIVGGLAAIALLCSTILFLVFRQRSVNQPHTLVI